jgi:hypothetical protein
MHYMTKPVLFENITLCSYDTIRYRDDRPEGLGSSSPFAMGLNALVTRDVGSLVRSLTLQGQWREHDLEEFASAGRVPDDAMMLNIAIRAAIDRCNGMESFKSVFENATPSTGLLTSHRWNLNTKLLSNVYSGLASLPKLQRLHIRFPSSRSPQPLAVLPGMSSLRSLTVTHMDPLCYPDDIALALFASPKLEALQLHWSPRMRDVGEPSVQLHSYFRHNIAAKKRLKLKHIGFYNLFALTSSEIEDIFDHSHMQSITMLNAFGVDDEGGQKSSLATFLDGSWSRPPDNLVQLKSLRHDKMSKRFARHLGDIYGMEKIYLVNARHVPPQNGHHPPSDPSPTSVSTLSSDPSSETIPSARTAANNSVRDLCLDIIISNHGPTLKHLVLPDRWPLPNKLIARLFNACPNITQLALALELRDGFGGMRMLLPFLKKIRAVRILMPIAGLYSEEQLKNFQSIVSAEDKEHEEHMGQELAGDDFPELRYVGIGWKVWEIGGTYEKMVMNEDGQEEMVLRRRSKRVGRDAVRDVEIWKMDSLDIV